MRLTPLVKKWGLVPSSVIRTILLSKERNQFVEIRKAGKIHTYYVKDPEGLKQFLIKKGFPVKEETSNA